MHTTSSLFFPLYSQLAVILIQFTLDANVYISTCQVHFVDWILLVVFVEEFFGLVQTLRVFASFQLKSKLWKFLLLVLLKCCFSSFTQQPPCT